MWTINDFPTYGMLSGWSMHGKLACPYCMENNKAFTLTNGGKASFFYCHRHFLPYNHRYRKDFFVGRVEKDVASSRLSGEEFIMLYQSTMTLCLVFNQVSKSFLVLV
jgi:hypothetical protein